MISERFSPPELACSAAAAAVRPLHALLAAPSLLFLATLAVMLFRPPDLHLYSLDRVAFAVLVFVVLMSALAQRQSLRMTDAVTWPMLVLLLLTLYGVMTQPYNAQNWSLFAAKWAVPFVLFHLAGLVFEDATSLRKFETFALIVLAYLSLTAIFFLIGAKALIFPRFILDESLGIHADRARGPFLQAVANGVTLNLLGLIALNSFRRGRLRGVLAVLFLIALPLAILATKTRAVWFVVRRLGAVVVPGFPEHTAAARVRWAGVRGRIGIADNRWSWRCERSTRRPAGGPFAGGIPHGRV